MTLVVILGIVGAVVYATNLDANADRRELAEANAVRVLPSGVEEAWAAYVDRRLASAIRREGDVVRVVGVVDSYSGKTTYVSANTPHDITCFSDLKRGAWVSFGLGDNRTLVPIFGVMSHGPDSETPPALGVSPSSVASAKLSKALCQRIRDHLQVTMTQATVTPALVQAPAQINAARMRELDAIANGASE